MFNNNFKGIGGMPGFGRGKKGTLSNGDWDKDGVKNRNDCEPLNFRKQGPEHKQRWMPEGMSKTESKAFAKALREEEEQDMRSSFDMDDEDMESFRRHLKSKRRI